jgi:uncharacterized protein
VKININQISAERLTQEEEIAASKLDLETEIIKFRGPLKVKAEFSKITNTVTVDLTLQAPIYATCGRCLNDFEINLHKKLKLNYPVSACEKSIDLDPAIREEVILEYPIKPLCKDDCQGLCPKCGEDLNKGECSCATT